MRALVARVLNHRLEVAFGILHLRLAGPRRAGRRRWTERRIVVQHYDRIGRQRVVRRGRRRLLLMRWLLLMMMDVMLVMVRMRLVHGGHILTWMVLAADGHTGRMVHLVRGDR